MDPLTQASQEGDIDGLYAAIQNNPHILSIIDEMQFVNTPLHIAASKGYFRFAAEIMSLKPSLAKKLNQEGFSPMHLALQSDQFQTASRLLDMDREVVRVKGRGGVTPLHYVAELGKIDLLTEFLVACPNSIQDLTICRETALHIAVKQDKWEALRVLCGWVQFTGQNGVLNLKDDEGNTILHIATSKSKIEIVKLLVSKRKIDLNVKNMNDKTALDILDEFEPQSNRAKAIKHILSRAGALKSSKLSQKTTIAETLTKNMSSLEEWALARYREKLSMSDENRNAILVVAVLIATTTYQAVISPPGGIWEGDPTLVFPQHEETSGEKFHRQLLLSIAGAPILRYFAPGEWLAFSLLNATTFITSLGVIYSLLPKRPLVILPLIIPMFLCFVLTWISSQAGTLHQGTLVFFFVAIPLVLRGISNKLQNAWKELGHLISNSDSLKVRPGECH